MTRREYRRLVAIIRKEATADQQSQKWWGARAPLDDEMYFGRTLRADCDGCGACCRNLHIAIETTDCEREPKLFRVSLPMVQSVAVPVSADGSPEFVPILSRTGGHELWLAQTSTCPMLAGNRCSIHETKPDVCRTSPPGGFCCQYSRAKEGLPALPLGSPFSVTT